MKNTFRVYFVLVLLTFAFGCANTVTLRGYEDYKLSDLKQFSGAKEIDLEVQDDPFKLAPLLRDVLSRHFLLTPKARYRIVVEYYVYGLNSRVEGDMKATGIFFILGSSYILDSHNKEMLKLPSLAISNNPREHDYNPDFLIADNPIKAFVDAVLSMILHSSNQ